MRTPNRSVFVNCPFDFDYQPIQLSLFFAILACGYRPRSALEIIDSGQPRLAKILDLIEQCDFSIHDICRTELNHHGLPRFNMPFELGLAIGCNRYGRSRDRQSKMLVLDRDPHRFRVFLSDLSGHDPESHEANPEKAIARVRDWLSMHRRKHQPLAGAAFLIDNYRTFMADLPFLCRESRLDVRDLRFHDQVYLIDRWLKTMARRTL